CEAVRSEEQDRPDGRGRVAGGLSERADPGGTDQDRAAAAAGGTASAALGLAGGAYTEDQRPSRSAQGAGLLYSGGEEARSAGRWGDDPGGRLEPARGATTEPVRIFARCQAEVACQVTTRWEPRDVPHEGRERCRRQEADPRHRAKPCDCRKLLRQRLKLL